MTKPSQQIIEVVTGNIVECDVDAIVNAANSSLLGGGGVDGAIHKAAGPDLVHECRLLGGCKTGQAKITSGYRLKARHIIHTVGPVWQGGDKGERELLAACHEKSLQLAQQHGLRSIAFPAISTGRFKFPLSEAARVAVETVRQFIRDNPVALDRVLFIGFDEATSQHFREAVWSAGQG
nr:O-acetyl-ADP-ribose deacetylase [Paraurantiacibacter namhicola]